MSIGMKQRGKFLEISGCDGCLIGLLVMVVGGGEKLVHFGDGLDPLEWGISGLPDGVKAERSEPIGPGLDATG